MSFNTSINMLNALPAENPVPLPIRLVKSPEPPMLPNTIVTTLTAHPKLHPDIIQAIANSLLTTIAQHKTQAAIEVCHLQEQIKGLYDCIKHYENQFKQAPNGYIVNDEQVPQFYIPLGDRVHCPTKWIKRLDNGRVAGFHEGQGPNESLYIIDLYTQADTIGHGEEKPIKLLPTWFHTLLLGPSGNFVHLQNEVKDLNNWGMAQEITCFHKLNQEAMELTLQVKVLYKELNTTCNARTMSEKWLVLTRASQKTAWLKNLLRKVSMPHTYSRHKNNNWWGHLI